MEFMPLLKINCLSQVSGRESTRSGLCVGRGLKEASKAPHACPVFVKFSDTTAFILVSLFGGTSQKTSSREPRPQGTSCRREVVTQRPSYLPIGPCLC